MAGKLASRVKGLSEGQFREAPGTEGRGRGAVGKLRWPKGFVCPLCGSCEGRWLSTRPKIQCRACRPQVSLTAGTIFHATKLPLTSWFLAMWLVATAKNGISPVELGRGLGIKQTNARALEEKIMHVMAGRDGKRLFVAAASTGGDRRPRKIKLLPVKGFRKRDVKRLIAERPASTSRLVTDGLGCWTAAVEAGLEHRAIVTGGKRAAGRSPFEWVNTIA